MYAIDSTIPRVRLAQLPTPLHRLERLSAELGGPEIWMKRDDLTGLATGGNKARKLEFLVADALAEGADTLLTVGAQQSNHARQTAAAAARYGLRAVLVLSGHDPGVWNGNLLLDRLLGARVVWTENRTRDEAVAQVVAQEETAGHSPYVIRVGGSTSLGALGYVAAISELAEQADGVGLKVDHIVFASSSGGTQSGMVVGARAACLHARILGISTHEPAERLRAMVLELADQTSALLGLGITIKPDEVLVNGDYMGTGYAVLGPPERQAIEMLARTEGVFVDPVYTGRALAGLIDLVRRGAFAPDEAVVFWHTGGSAALFAYAQDLL